jgi:hypothetical protein
MMDIVDIEVEMNAVDNPQDFFDSDIWAGLLIVGSAIFGIVLLAQAWHIGIQKGYWGG